MTSVSSKGCSNIIPLVVDISSAKLDATTSRFCEPVAVERTNLAPNPRIRSSLTGGASWGETMQHGIPTDVAAAAKAIPKFPELKATTPLAESCGGNRKIRCRAPRYLNDPVVCKHSALTKTLVPNSLLRRGDSSNGVRITSC
mmetsp:Transcript_31857/g.48469  ORF Transcript_31857/g.48469 Transcript_31857/m.48469 type:complete len:143 (+) Transcript_31857:518-946(+)